MRDYEKMSDQELLAAILEGDEAAFAEFTHRYRNQISKNRAAAIGARVETMLTLIEL